MKVLILYKSNYGNTRQVAEALARQIEGLGHNAEVRDLRLRLPNLKDVDCALIGAPTRIGRATWKARRALRRLRRKRFGAKPLGIFDTYGPLPVDPGELEKNRKWFYPGAAGRMQEKAQKLGLNVFLQTLRCQVQGMKGPLKEGEAGKAAQFAREFIATIENK
ncbi:MAG: flavodoxin domain-containing protein [Acidobacteria bacterium]|nr:flavodoxin domain-containing protein [Acidobacteriota bacterium]MBU4306305.1 flavodoxin domain-containing protein [Acidobacteriota bacterium]MBU4404586.1 flavodoxin domain-containing protein [Acidobacteriota bacterium]MCG2812371.1 flavodoxin domain-containing protein [Candidatus Aminicenantes bacterium]